MRRREEVGISRKRALIGRPLIVCPDAVPASAPKVESCDSSCDDSESKNEKREAPAKAPINAKKTPEEYDSEEESNEESSEEGDDEPKAKKIKVISYTRGSLLFIFNFHPEVSQRMYSIGVEEAGEYKKRWLPALLGGDIAIQKCSSIQIGKNFKSETMILEEPEDASVHCNYMLSWCLSVEHNHSQKRRRTSAITYANDSMHSTTIHKLDAIPKMALR